ncbi:MAG: thioredoxin-disulfide reductase [Alphaproteobacteria bacterium]|nr:thioredoxin-disulfide reductase [Alphaproteobacteria bacterium]
MQVQREKQIILGSGPAGYTAAIYASRAMMEPLIIQGAYPGGQMMITTDVENYPGFPDAVQGPELMERMRLQALNLGTRIAEDHITMADLSSAPFQLQGSNGKAYECDVLVICTGARARWLGLPSEDMFKGFGVSACSTCDGFFYREKEVIVVGGGNTALEDALFLDKFASQITILHRRDSFRAEKILQNLVFKNPKIKIKWNTVLDEVIGNNKPRSVTGAILRNLKTGDTETQEVDGIFIAIGQIPETGLFKGQLEISPSGHLITTPGSTATSCPGVFAAGDVIDNKFRQAITAAGMGCMATLESQSFLESQSHKAHTQETG